MKPNILTSLIIIATACSGSLRAQTVSGTQLEIGPTGSDQVSGTDSGAMGLSNIVAKDFSFAAGIGNIVAGNGSGSTAIGSTNRIGYGWPGGGDNSLAVGYANSIQGYESFTVGSGNYLVGSDYEWVGSSNCLLAGTYNTSAGISSFIAGENNYITGDSDNGHTYATAAIGKGLISSWSKSLIIGQYNDISIPQLSGLLFAIGNGPDAEHRSNAYEIYASGKINMARQGDILMGEFGNPEP